MIWPCSTSASAVTVDLVSGIGSGGDAASDSYANIEKVVGSAYADALSSSTAGHVLAGGAGDDVYIVGNSSVVVTEVAGEGTDEVQTGLASLNIAGFANVENLTYTGTGNFTGTGNAGDNILTGGAGNDILTGGAGADQLIGDAGTDTVDYSTSASAVTVDLTLGTGSGGDAAGDSFVSIEKVIGSAYADTLSSSSAGDILVGGAGDDIYVVGNSGVVVTEAAGGGVDTVHASISGDGYSLYDDSENLILFDNTTFGVGNALDNQLTGNDIGNSLWGGDGNDTLNGKAGDDLLYGEAGADTFVFDHGTGSDVIGDFIHDTDKFDIHAFGFASFVDLQAAFSQNGDDGAIDLGGGDFILLNNITMSQLSANDFFL